MKKIIKAKPRKLQTRKKEHGYEEDLYLWAFEQAKFLKEHKYEKLDMENLIEEIESLGKSQRSALRSFLRVLLMHLLKIEYQPEKHSSSWDVSVFNSRTDAKYVLKENPSLKHKLKQIFNEAYKLARYGASLETHLELEIFPEECPWTIKEVLGE